METIDSKTPSELRAMPDSARTAWLMGWRIQRSFSALEETLRQSADAAREATAGVQALVAAFPKCPRCGAVISLDTGRCSACTG